jgi:eukaryotic-like serine/threonine-protein kinase
VLTIGIQLCEVLDYLHRHQPPVIFRDVKPSNVMLTSGRKLFLIDFGVARYFQPGKRRDTIAFGSPGFAAPEQYGKAQTNPQSDIYSLGVTLYQLLTGIDPSLTPFRFLPLHLLDASIPAELERLIMQMLEMEASKRPADMALVRKELQGITEKRRDDTAGSVASGQAAQPKGKAPITFSTQGLTRYIYRGHRSFVNAVAWSPDGRYIASGSLDQTVQVWEALSGKDHFVYHNHHDAVSSVAWSPGGTQIASGSLDQTVQVWDAVSKPLWLRAFALRTGFMYFKCEGHTSGVQAVTWSPDGLYIASGGDDNMVIIWEAVPQAVPTHYYGHSARVLAVAWSPVGKYIASTSTDRSARIWDVNTKSSRCVVRDPAHIFHALCWSPGGKYLALASSDHTVQVWDAGLHHKVFTHKGHSRRVRAVAWSLDGKYLASASDDRTVQVWKVHYQPEASHEEPFVYSSHSKSVHTVAWSPDGRLIASAGEDGEVHVWQSH